MPEVASLPGQTCTSAMTAHISLDHDLTADWRSAEQLSRARARMQRPHPCRNAQQHAKAGSCCSASSCCIAHRLTSTSRCIPRELDVIHPAGLVLLQERVQLRVCLCCYVGGHVGPHLAHHCACMSKDGHSPSAATRFKLNQCPGIQEESALLREYAISSKLR